LPRIIRDTYRPGIYYLGDQLDQAIWRSIDFGETWERRGGIPYEGFPALVSGLLLDPLEDETLYAAVEDAVWFSEDGGQQWTEIGPVHPGETVFTLEFHPEDRVSMYAVTTGGIYLSEDRALSWKPLLKPGGMRWLSGQLRFDPHDPNHFYLVTGRYLYESGDAGQTWVEISQGFEGFPWFNDLAFDPFDESVVYVTTTWGVYKLDRASVVTAVEETATLPSAFSLSPAYPNPFNPSTTIRFTLPQPGEAELAIYNLLGQKMATLARGVQEAGPHTLAWNGRDEYGRELSSGVYLCRLRAGGRVETRKLLLLR
jgi:hypothetical protein